MDFSFGIFVLYLYLTSNTDHVHYSFCPDTLIICMLREHGSSAPQCAPRTKTPRPEVSGRHHFGPLKLTPAAHVPPACTLAVFTWLLRSVNTSWLGQRYLYRHENMYLVVFSFIIQRLLDINYLIFEIGEIWRHAEIWSGEWLMMMSTFIELLMMSCCPTMFIMYRICGSYNVLNHIVSLGISISISKNMTRKYTLD